MEVDVKGFCVCVQCVNSPDIRHPCSLSPLREPFAKRQCAVLLGEVFQACHAVVSDRTAAAKSFGKSPHTAVCCLTVIIRLLNLMAMGTVDLK